MQLEFKNVCNCWHLLYRYRSGNVSWFGVPYRDVLRGAHNLGTGPAGRWTLKEEKSIPLLPWPAAWTAASCLNPQRSWSLFLLARKKKTLWKGLKFYTNTSPYPEALNNLSVQPFHAMKCWLISLRDYFLYFKELDNMQRKIFAAVWSSQNCEGFCCSFNIPCGGFAGLSSHSFSPHPVSG